MNRGKMAPSMIRRTAALPKGILLPEHNKKACPSGQALVFVCFNFLLLKLKCIGCVEHVSDLVLYHSLDSVTSGSQILTRVKL